MSEELKPFCNSCGLCCARVGVMVEAAKMMQNVKDRFVQAIASFPYNYNDAGRCEMLGEDNLCKVYETRPLVCSIEKLHDNYFRHQVSKKKFYEMSKSECLKLIAASQPSLPVLPSVS